MKIEEVYHWLVQSERRMQVIRNASQPMTAVQMSKRIGVDQACCTYLLWELLVYSVVQCLNPFARRSRLYWLTRLGKQCQRRLLESESQPAIVCKFKGIDWDLYGYMCYSHRSAIVRAMDGPMQPSAIKRKAAVQNPSLRMSANNVRDVMQLLLERGIVKTVSVHRKSHRHYELTEVGKEIRTLLRNVGG